MRVEHFMPAKRTHVIVLGNEKGGTGKSSTAFGLAVFLLRQGHQVATLDVDSRQQTLTRYIENRTQWSKERQVSLPQPHHYHLPVSRGDTIRDRNGQDWDMFRAAIGEVDGEVDYLIIDTPGFDTHLSRLAHALADTLITPVNDSLIDLDGLCRLDLPGRGQAVPGHYARLVRRARQQRREMDGGEIDWVLLRNRVSPLPSRNSIEIGKFLARVSNLLGCRVIPGLVERTVYRSLFASGLSVFDTGAELASYANAVQQAGREYFGMVRSLNLADWTQVTGSTSGIADPFSTAKAIRCSSTQKFELDMPAR